LKTKFQPLNARGFTPIGDELRKAAALCFEEKA
jgi:hypothetical protein